MPQLPSNKPLPTRRSSLLLTRQRSRTGLLLAGLLAVLVIGFTQGASGEEVTQEQAEYFEIHVRPILSQHCKECHGPEKQEGGLRLDLRESVFQGGDSGPVLTAGNVEASRLIEAIRYTDPDMQMPPDEALPKETVAKLEAWVKMGAPWPKSDSANPKPRDAKAEIEEARNSHWSFRPIDSEPPVELPGDQWSRGDLDRYVLGRLIGAGLSPSPEADRRTLIRRAYFDLIGLPPTYQEIQEFVNDPAEDAYEQLIDRLLAKPEYGQHWARHWLDVARYSDTKGYVGVGDREERYPYAWTYRDYVVRALNEDLPYDKFILHQLAADQLDLPEEKRWALAGMGFMTVGPRYFNRQHRIIGDRIDVTTRGLLGMTMMCARCHDHKFDPLLSEDYYGLYGVFASSYEKPYHLQPTLGPAPTGPERQAKFQKRLDKWMGKYHREQREIREKATHEMRAFAADYLQFVVHRMKRHGKTEGLNYKTERTTLRQRGNGTGGIGRWRKFIASRSATDPVFGLWKQLAQLPRDEFSSKAPVVIASAEGANRLVVEALLAKPLTSMVEVARVYGKLFEDTYVSWQEHLKQDSNASSLSDLDAEALRNVLYGEDSPTIVRDETDAKNLLIGGEGKDFRKYLLKVEQELARSVEDLVPRAMTMNDLDRPRNTPIHLRGDPSRRGAVVPRRFLQVLSHVDGGKPFKQGSGRLELAQAIVHPENPLTARVMVNRVWMWHFGEGIVRTPSNFGKQGEEPTHPELLDSLARQFIENGWSIKSLHRQIMTSSTYRQASVNRESCHTVDPMNRLLWKMNRRRLSFESMRDSLLTTTGELNTAVGGLPFGGLGSSRRTLYKLVDRKNTPRLLMDFDVSVPDATIGKRPNTTVPQQALYLLNNGFLGARARKMVTRLDRDLADAKPAKRIERIYRWLYGRDPQPNERAIGERFLLAAAQDPPPPPLLGSVGQTWQHGTGSYDPKAKKVGGFTSMTHFDRGKLQQAPSSLKSGAAFLAKRAGKPGPDSQHVVIRRWTAPEAGLFLFKGPISLVKPERGGDGIQAWVVSDRQGELGRYDVAKSRVNVRIERIVLAAGEQIDFIVGAREENSFDTFQWPIQVWKVRDNGNGGLLGKKSWLADVGFEENIPGWLPKVSPWEQYVQALLISNEFMFVD